MKKKTIFLIAIITLCGIIITGCDNSKNNESKEPIKEEEKTIATELTKLFDETIEETTDLEKIANTINESDIIIPDTLVVEINKGDYVEGFNTDITGFNKAYSVKPMISSIPFIVYIFEVDNPEDFEQTLKDNYNIRWNICVDAEEMKTSRKDNIIFFIMSPKTFSE